MNSYLTVIEILSKSKLYSYGVSVTNDEFSQIHDIFGQLTYICAQSIYVRLQNEETINSPSDEMRNEHDFCL